MSLTLADGTRFAYHSPLARQLAEVYSAAADLQHCQRLLRDLDPEAGQQSENVLRTALGLYAHAFLGAMHCAIPVEKLSSFGPVLLVLHRDLLSGLHPKRNWGVVISVRGEEVHGVEAEEISDKTVGRAVVDQWLALIEAIHCSILGPRLKELEAAVLDEAKILGIRLVRQLPLVS